VVQRVTCDTRLLFVDVSCDVSDTVNPERTSVELQLEVEVAFW
jgi:hypothetical protein